MSGRHHGPGAGHRHLYVAGSTPVHRLAPHTKIAGLVAFVVVVALTPRTEVVAFAVFACIVAGVAALARLAVSLVARRLLTIAPFIAFAVALPFVAGGETTEVLGIDVSVDGLWAAWNVAAKAILGASASIVVTATTTIPALLRGLSRLRVPAPIVGIIGFMFRYLDLITDEFARVRRAMTARAYAPRWIWQSGPIATSAGTLFVRTYERGERVHDAMAARGFTGTMPAVDHESTSGRDWLLALGPAALALVAFVASVVT